MDKKDELQSFLDGLSKSQLLSLGNILKNNPIMTILMEILKRIDRIKSNNKEG